MATVPELILNTLEELKDHQLSKFQWFLYSKTIEHYPHIPRSWLEGASRTDTVDILVEMYCNDDAVMVTLDVLTRMKLKLRAEMLKEDYEKGITDCKYRLNGLQFKCVTVFFFILSMFCCQYQEAKQKAKVRS